MQTFHGDSALPNAGQLRSAWAGDPESGGDYDNWSEKQSHPPSASCQVLKVCAEKLSKVLSFWNFFSFGMKLLQFTKSYRAFVFVLTACSFICTWQEIHPAVSLDKYLLPSSNGEVFGKVCPEPQV